MFTVHNTFSGSHIETPEFVKTYKQAVEYAAAVLATFVGNVSVRASGDYRSFLVTREDSQAKQRFVVRKPV